MYPYGNYLANLKTHRRDDDNLTAEDPVTVTYSKVDRTVKFTSKNFEYSQENLPEKEFAMAIELIEEGQETQIKFLKIW